MSAGGIVTWYDRRHTRIRIFQELFNHLGLLVGTQQPEQLQRSGRRHEIALAAHNTNIYSDLGETTIATLSPALEDFPRLSFPPPSNPHRERALVYDLFEEHPPHNPSGILATHRKDLPYHHATGSRRVASQAAGGLRGSLTIIPLETPIVSIWSGSEVVC